MDKVELKVPAEWDEMLTSSRSFRDLGLFDLLVFSGLLISALPGVEDKFNRWDEIVEGLQDQQKLLPLPLDDEPNPISALDYLIDLIIDHLTFKDQDIDSRVNVVRGIDAFLSDCRNIGTFKGKLVNEYLKEICEEELL